MPLKVIQKDKDSVTWQTLTKMTSECRTIQSMCIHDVRTSMNSKCWVKSYQTMHLQVLFSMLCLENKLGISLYSRKNNDNNNIYLPENIQLQKVTAGLPVRLQKSKYMFGTIQFQL
ncbi:Hypothetical_protein [Hexamita inflata]|uniref:Hypothetical_protein n=1 Tax=Hexamita inflata TaxID=28002 RepID=A0AA86TTN4_9EUKA|nr:Hypothetical protein HINF_LOCUS14162 [Hexamita inflata]